MSQRSVPGMLAVIPGGARPPVSIRDALIEVGLADASVYDTSDYTVASWGLSRSFPATGEPLLLSGTNWSDDGAAEPATIAQWLESGNLHEVHRMLPPFAALGTNGNGLCLVSDPMGFRQLYLINGTGWTAVSTSARLLAALGDTGLDEEALLLQSQLGWQLGQRTLFSRVAKLAPGESVVLDRGQARRDVPATTLTDIGMDDGVEQAAVVMRDFLSRYLDENTDPTLQLTGGQDSRLILSAIPRTRRRGLKVMTLGIPGAGDAELAAELAHRFGMQHTVRTLEGLQTLTPEDAFDRACAASSRLDCMADPLARAATLWAEQFFEQGPRLSGLGGEIARGFYYTGKVHPSPVTRARVERLAGWRMLANEAVEGVALSPRLRDRAVPTAIGFIHDAIADAGEEWFAATDELYYLNRMQRWAGAGETAVCFDRSIANPMLDHRFLAIARGLDPQDKQNSRFLARLQVRLDSELASIRLDNRPAPNAYATPGIANLARQRAAKAASAARKVHQRFRGARRPPPGGAVLATKVALFLQREPGVVDPVRNLDLFDPAWLDGLTAGEVRPSPASLALLVNALVAVDRAARTA